MSNVGREIIKKWGDQWYWKVTVILKTGDRAEHTWLTLEDANDIEKEAKRSKMTKKVIKERQAKRED